MLNQPEDDKNDSKGGLSDDSGDEFLVSDHEENPVQSADKDIREAVDAEYGESDKAQENSDFDEEVKPSLI